jgi:hypothetical protein
MSLTAAIGSRKRKAGGKAGGKVDSSAESTTHTSDEHKRRYALAALKKECAELASSAVGERNHRANKAGFYLGQLIAAGALSEHEVQSALREAAKRCNLTQDDGETATEATIASGIESGKKEPRDIPPPKAKAERFSHVRKNGSGNGNGATTEPPDYGDEPAPSDEQAPDAPQGDGGEQQSGPKPRAKIEIIDAAAIFAPLQEPVYVVDGIIRAGSLVEIAAYGNSGKSWIAINLCVSVAAGLPWLDRFETTQGPTLFLDYENGSFETRRRFQADAGARGLPVPVNGISLATMPPLYMTSPGFESQIAPLADGRSLVVVDTLKAASPGVDENASDMRAGLDILHRVGERTGCAFAVLLHAKKTSGNPFTIDAREAGRGSSAIFDAADTVLHVSYEKGKPLLVQQSKSRLGRHVEPFQVHIEDVDGGVRVWAEDVPEDQGRGNDVAFGELCDKVLELVRGNPGGSGRIYRARAGARPGDVLAALEHLERHGAVRNAGTERNAKWFPTQAGGTE